MFVLSLQKLLPRMGKTERRKMREATQYLEKILNDMVEKKWITINSDLRTDAIARHILSEILHMPYLYMANFIKELLP